MRDREPILLGSLQLVVVVERIRRCGSHFFSLVRISST